MRPRRLSTFIAVAAASAVAAGPAAAHERDPELAKRFAAAVGGDLPAAETDHGDSEFVG